MAFSFKETFNFLKESFSEFSDDECTTMAAALAYYTIFSLAPLLVIIITIAGLVLGEEAARGEIQGQISGLLGADAAHEVETMIENTSKRESGSILSAVLGLAALIFGATGAFTQLQAALNRAWEVEPDPEAGGLKSFVLKRILSFGMILGIAFLLLVSLAVSAALSAFGNALAQMLPGILSGPMLWVFNLVLSLTVITLLFAAIYKVLPDAKISWRDVWVGAFLTGVLFVIGKFLIGFYLGNSDVGSAFGAAGSLVIILVWIYYASIIVFLGAEMTQIWAKRYGDEIEPEPGAVRVETKRRHVREDAPGRA